MKPNDITQHSDSQDVAFADKIKSIAKTIGAPQNLLTLDRNGQQFSKELLEGFMSHYSNLQKIFANDSADFLIGLAMKFSGESFFDLKKPNQVTLAEVTELEKLYKEIADARLNISINAAFDSPDERDRLIGAKVFFERKKLSEDENYLRFHKEITNRTSDKAALFRWWEACFKDSKEARQFIAHFKELAFQPNTELIKQFDLITNLVYRPSQFMTSTYTQCFQDDERYGSYYTSHKKLVGLFLNDIVSLLGVVPKTIDQKTALGTFEGGRMEDDRAYFMHTMGYYRIMETDGNIGQNRQECFDRMNRVDEVTALAAKKALTTKGDMHQELKYAFIFGILRGYNLRNVSGACWAHEMSTRWIFAQKGWPQFTKAAGVYLDIAAVHVMQDEGTKSAETLLDEMLNKQIDNYLKSLQPTKDDNYLYPYFVMPQPASEQDLQDYAQRALIREAAAKANMSASQYDYKTPCFSAELALAKQLTDNSCKQSSPAKKDR